MSARSWPTLWQRSAHWSCPCCGRSRQDAFIGVTNKCIQVAISLSMSAQVDMGIPAQRRQAIEVPRLDWPRQVQRVLPVPPQNSSGVDTRFPTNASSIVYRHRCPLRWSRQTSLYRPAGDGIAVSASPDNVSPAGHDFFLHGRYPHGARSPATLMDAPMSCAASRHKRITPQFAPSHKLCRSTQLTGNPSAPSVPVGAGEGQTRDVRRHLLVGDVQP